jgi:ABC-type sugar transport system permease subunit
MWFEISRIFSYFVITLSLIYESNLSVLRQSLSDRWNWFRNARVSVITVVVVKTVLQLGCVTSALCTALQCIESLRDIEKMCLQYKENKI